MLAKLGTRRNNMDKQRTELIIHSDQPGSYEFGVEDWHRGGVEAFEITEEQKFEIREMAVALVNRCIELKVPVQVFAIGGIDERGELLMNTGNLWPPCRVPYCLLAATSIFKRARAQGLAEVMALLDFIEEEGPRKPAGGKR